MVTFIASDEAVTTMVHVITSTERTLYKGYGFVLGYSVCCVLCFSFFFPFLSFLFSPLVYVCLLQGSGLAEQCFTMRHIWSPSVIITSPLYAWSLLDSSGRLIPVLTVISSSPTMIPVFLHQQFSTVSHVFSATHISCLFSCRLYFVLFLAYLCFSSLCHYYLCMTHSPVVIRSLASTMCIPSASFLAYLSVLLCQQAPVLLPAACLQLNFTINSFNYCSSLCLRWVWLLGPWSKLVIDQNITPCLLC